MLNFLKSIYKKIIPLKIRTQIIIYKIRISNIFNIGNNSFCPCCNNSFDHFLNYGVVPRKEAMCPNCLSLERTRALWLYLINEYKILDKEIKLLHVSPEFAIKDSLKKMNNIDYLSIDIHKDMADYVMDVTDLKFEENSFDLIICSHVLGFVFDENKALNELRRVLKTNGILIIQTHFYNESNSKNLELSSTFNKFLYTENDLLRLHGIDFVQKLKALNFVVEILDYSNSIKFSKFKLGSGEREKLIICFKI